MRWNWRVTLYYAEDVAPPKQPGGLAIQTVHGDEVGRDMEISVAQGRADIGPIMVERWCGTDWGYWGHHAST